MKKIIISALLLGTFLSPFLSHAQLFEMNQQMRMERRTRENYLNRKANGESVSLFEGMESSLSLPLWSVNYEHSYDVYDNYNTSNYGPSRNVIGNEKVTRKVPAKGCIFSSKYSWILAKMASKCNLALSLSPTCGIISYNIGKVNIPYHSYEQPISGFLLGIPLTLDLKAGGEATFDKSDALSFSCGVGIAPVGYLSGFLNAASFKGSVSPCIHAGFGFFLGAEWKIQASILGGSMDVLNLKDKEDLSGQFNNNTVIKARTTGSMTTIGIVCFPFSFGWDKGGW